MRDHPALRHSQRGAALATALFFLVILTILGLAAMRSGSLGLRLAENENQRVDALQNAQTSMEAIMKAAPFTVVPTTSLPTSLQQACFLGTGLDAGKLSTQQGFSCSASGPVQTAFMQSGNLQSLLQAQFSPYVYGSVTRSLVNGGNEYAPTSAVGAGDSGDRYQLAAFDMVSGYDHVATSDSNDLPQGGAEINQGIYVRVAQIRGLTRQ